MPSTDEAYNRYKRKKAAEAYAKAIPKKRVDVSWDTGPSMKFGGLSNPMYLNPRQTPIRDAMSRYRMERVPMAPKRVVPQWSYEDEPLLEGLDPRENWNRWGRMLRAPRYRFTGDPLYDMTPLQQRLQGSDIVRF